MATAKRNVTTLNEWLLESEADNARLTTAMEEAETAKQVLSDR